MPPTTSPMAAASFLAGMMMDRLRGLLLVWAFAIFVVVRWVVRESMADLLLADCQGLGKGAVLLAQNPLKIGAASPGLLGDLLWLIARVCLKARFCCAKSAKPSLFIRLPLSR